MQYCSFAMKYLSIRQRNEKRFLCLWLTVLLCTSQLAHAQISYMGCAEEKSGIEKGVKFYLATLAVLSHDSLQPSDANYQTYQEKLVSYRVSNRLKTSVACYLLHVESTSDNAKAKPLISFKEEHVVEESDSVRLSVAEINLENITDPEAVFHHVESMAVGSGWQQADIPDASSGVINMIVHFPDQMKTLSLVMAVAVTVMSASNNGDYGAVQLSALVAGMYGSALLYKLAVFKLIYGGMLFYAALDYLVNHNLKGLGDGCFVENIKFYPEDNFISLPPSLYVPHRSSIVYPSGLESLGDHSYYDFVEYNSESIHLLRTEFLPNYVELMEQKNWKELRSVMRNHYSKELGESSNLVPTNPADVKLILDFLWVVGGLTLKSMWELAVSDPILLISFTRFAQSSINLGLDYCFDAPWEDVVIPFCRHGSIYWDVDFSSIKTLLLRHGVSLFVTGVALLRLNRDLGVFVLTAH